MKLRDSYTPFAAFRLVVFGGVAILSFIGLLNHVILACLAVVWALEMNGVYRSWDQAIKDWSHGLDHWRASDAAYVKLLSYFHSENLRLRAARRRPWLS